MQSGATFECHPIWQLSGTVAPQLQLDPMSGFWGISIPPQNCGFVVGFGFLYVEVLQVTYSSMIRSRTLPMTLLVHNHWAVLQLFQSHLHLSPPRAIWILILNTASVFSLSHKSSRRGFHMVISYGLHRKTLNFIKYPTCSTIKLLL